MKLANKMLDEGVHMKYPFSVFDHGIWLFCIRCPDLYVIKKQEKAPALVDSTKKRSRFLDIAVQISTPIQFLMDKRMIHQSGLGDSDFSRMRFKL